MRTTHAPRRRRLVDLLWLDRSLVGRLLLVQSLILVLAMAAVVAVATVTFGRQSMSDVDAGLADDITEFKTAATGRPADQSLASFAAAYVARQPFELGTYMIVLTGGDGVQGSRGSAGLRADPAILGWLRSPPAVGTYADLVLGDVRFRLRASTITEGSLPVGGVVSVTDLTSVDARAQSVATLIALEAGAAVLLAVLTTSAVLRRVLRVVGEVTRTAGSYTIESPGRRLDEQAANDEIGRLVHTFNEMLGRLEASTKAQRDLLSDVSHQLRTPLTVMRGHLEVARRAGFDDPAETRDTIDLVLDELGHAGVLVDRVLVLGHSLEPDFLQPEPVDLRSFLADVMTAARAMADRRWEMGPVPDVVVMLDREKARGAVLNLLDNAVKATREGDAIQAEAEIAAGGALIIAVADTGVGIPVEQQARILGRFERGTRLDERGSGLGLAIVAAVAEAHGGHVAIESAAGAGCTVRIVLPASRIVPPDADRGGTEA